MSYVIAIPSYRRSEICKTHTLKLLQEHGIRPEKIFVFVADDKEMAEYEDVLLPGTYNQIVLGVPGLVPQREFIMSYWPKGTKIVEIDDDISKVDLSLSKAFSSLSLDAFFETAFLECEKRGARIWGIYPVWNRWLRSGRLEISTCLCLIVGGFFGFINDSVDERITLEITRENSNKEDTERSIKYFLRDGIVLRFNTIGFWTRNYSRTGGMGSFQQRILPNREAALRLRDTYGDLGHIFVRKSGITEFKLKKVASSLC